MAASEEAGEQLADNEKLEAINPGTAGSQRGRPAQNKRAPHRDSMTGGQNQHGATVRRSSVKSTARAQALVRIGTRRRVGAVHGAAQRHAAEMHLGPNLPATNMGDVPSPI